MPVSFWDYMKKGQMPSYARNLNRGDYYAFGTNPQGELMAGQARFGGLRSAVAAPVVPRPSIAPQPQPTPLATAEAYGVPPVQDAMGTPQPGMVNIPGVDQSYQTGVPPPSPSMSPMERLQAYRLATSPNAMPSGERASMISKQTAEQETIRRAESATAARKAEEDYRTFELQKARERGIAAAQVRAGTEDRKTFSKERTEAEKLEVKKQDLALRDTISQRSEANAMKLLKAQGKVVLDPVTGQPTKEYLQIKTDDLEKQREEFALKEAEATTADERKQAAAEKEATTKLLLEHYKAQQKSNVEQNKPITAPAGGAEETPKVPDDRYNQAVQMTNSPGFKNLTPAEQARVESVVKAWKKQNAI